MARIASLNILLDTSGKDLLAEQYGAVIANVQKNCISQLIKNTALSGTPGAGTYEAKRFVNKSAQNYGTARAATHGQYVEAQPVVVQVNQNKEIVVEVEDKDVLLYGVDALVEREAASAQKAMIRALERAFFTEAVSAGSAATITAQTIEGQMEQLIQAVETVENDFVDGVERDDIVVVCNPKTYGDLRTYFDKVEAGNGTAESFGRFHGVRVFSSVYLPDSVDAIAMMEGAIAQPVLPKIYGAERIPLSDAVAFGLFFYYGTKAVAADLIFKMAATTTTGA